MPSNFGLLQESVSTRELKLYNICATLHKMQKYCWMRRHGEGQKVALLYVTRSCQFRSCKLSSSTTQHGTILRCQQWASTCMHISSAGFGDGWRVPEAMQKVSTQNSRPRSCGECIVRICKFRAPASLVPAQALNSVCFRPWFLEQSAGWAVAGGNDAGSYQSCGAVTVDSCGSWP